jgi:hypothetical protein
MKSQKAITAVLNELNVATQLHGPFHSAHEGYAVIKEELDELWDEIKLKSSERNPVNLREEAVQVAAMAIRFLVDIAEDEAVNEDLSSGCI